MGPPLWADVFTLKMVNTAIQYPSQTLIRLIDQLVKLASSFYWTTDPATIGRRSSLCITKLVWCRNAQLTTLRSASAACARHMPRGQRRLEGP